MLVGRRPKYIEDDQKAQELEDAKQQKKTKTVLGSVQVDTETLKKLRAIAYWERIRLKDLVGTAIKNYIISYEKSKGPIEVNPTPAKDLLNL